MRARGRVPWSGFGALLVACSTAPVQRSPAPEPCGAIPTWERMTVDAGAHRVSATGFGVRFEGASHDSFDDGRTDLWLSLVLQVEGEGSQSWLPSALAPSGSEVMLGHCVRVVGGSFERAELEVAPLAVAGAATALAACTDDPAIAPLEDYGTLVDGRRYAVDMARDATTGEWRPSPQPRMPHHHASRLSLRGLAKHPALAAAGTASPRFVVELISHTIEQEPGRHEWRAEYIARVIDVCRGGTTRR